MAIFKCGVCGYLFDGNEPPEFCPKCGAPREQFSKIDDAAEVLIKKARRTNDIHVKIAGLMEEAAGLAEEGVRENLDPPCVLLFQKCLKASWEIRQATKAEIQAHVAKGKWG